MTRRGKRGTCSFCLELKSAASEGMTMNEMDKEQRTLRWGWHREDPGRRAGIITGEKPLGRMVVSGGHEGQRVGSRNRQGPWKFPDDVARLRQPLKGAWGGEGTTFLLLLKTHTGFQGPRSIYPRTGSRATGLGTH